MTDKPKIALALPMGVPHLERVAYGIRQYAHQHCNWQFVASPETWAMSITSLEGWDGDGVIALVNTERELEIAKNLRSPVVNISGAIERTGLPRVRLDYKAAGGMAADHLLSRGFQRFAFYGMKSVWYSQQYGQGFIDQVKSHGGSCDVYESPSSIGAAQPWKHDAEGLERWLLGLAKPVGLMAAHDPRGAMVIEACGRIGLRVPQDVAVIGANDDTVTCDFCDPPLTSVARNGQKIGYETAALLDRLMKGAPPPAEDIVVAPRGVVERASTDVLAIDNEELARAVRFIHDNLHRPIGIEDICNNISMSRRWLEYEFKKTLRCTPHQYLSRVRVERAKKLLVGPERLKLKQVAIHCGFTSNKQMNIVFQRVSGTTPRQYRASKRKD